jgi:hypothetical protein
VAVSAGGNEDVVAKAAAATTANTNVLSRETKEIN